MSKYIDCTMPFYDYMPVGNVWAWDVPFRTEPITTHEKNSYELWMITMHSETGTRLMIKAMQDPNAPTVDRLPLNEFLNRDAVILDVPCGMDGAVTAEQVRSAAGNADIRKGDIFILRTGWGDDERYLELGDAYARRGPCISKEGAEELCRIMHPAWLVPMLHTGAGVISIRDRSGPTGRPGKETPSHPSRQDVSWLSIRLRKPLRTGNPPM